jgi:phenylalanyl-tRNA synthetase beta chain
VIVDGSDTVIGLAGIMGGESSEINEATTKVLLEVAAFDPMVIARTSEELALRSEASHRFERGVDFNALDAAAARFVEVLRWSCPDVQVDSFDVVDGDLPEQPRSRSTKGP